ncbi:hypothetical protein CAPTEDRAFT_193275 [Capitella teleta]|uniref:BTB domain-containing protein n=1 Tax=Capitella teleta TaxID=283909 RepID=R7UUY3_CAPTE|nr:hypothetical protein CAPTEDRAFT_193275 [Capitella teleta]|eukprot:ELU09985.1 hypothetical protein CAPTEDRAFT_193275 [Capitella teleta]
MWERVRRGSGYVFIAMAQAWQSLPSSFHRMREVEHFVDVTLVFGHRRISCHRVILAAACEYFRRMFQTNMVERASSEVVMTDISPSIGELVVNFVYGRKIELCMEILDDLLVACNMLQLGDLKYDVQNYLILRANGPDYIPNLKLARRYELDRVLCDSHEYVLHHTSEIDTDQLALLDEEEIIETLESSDSQEASFRLLQVWVRSAVGRIDNFVRLLGFIRLDKCSNDFILHTVMKEELMQNPQCSEIIDKAMQIDVNRVLVVGSYEGDMWMCRTFNQQWHLIPKSPSQNFAGSVCAVPGGIFVSGGLLNGYDQRDCYYYDAHTDRWNTLPPMPTGRRCHSCISFNGCVHIIGGSSDGKALESVDSFNMSLLEWRDDIGPLPRPLALSYTAAFADSIFVLGGYGEDAWIDLVYEYECKRGTWRERCPMPETCTTGSAVSFDEYIYVVGGTEKRCMRFHPDTNSWEEFMEPCVGHAHALTWRENILLCGGAGDDSIIEYSPLSNKWSYWVLKVPGSMNMHFALRIDLCPPQ